MNKKRKIYVCHKENLLYYISPYDKKREELALHSLIYNDKLEGMQLQYYIFKK